MKHFFLIFAVVISLLAGDRRETCRQHIPPESLDAFRGTEIICSNQSCGSQATPLRCAYGIPVCIFTVNTLTSVPSSESFRDDLSEEGSAHRVCKAGKTFDLKHYRNFASDFSRSPSGTLCKARYLHYLRRLLA